MVPRSATNCRTLQFNAIQNRPLVAIPLVSVLPRSLLSDPSKRPATKDRADHPRITTREPTGQPFRAFLRGELSWESANRYFFTRVLRVESSFMKCRFRSTPCQPKQGKFQPMLGEHGFLIACIYEPLRARLGIPLLVT
jgi:hypothetical protein